MALWAPFGLLGHNDFTGLLNPLGTLGSLGPLGLLDLPGLLAFHSCLIALDSFEPLGASKLLVLMVLMFLRVLLVL